MNKKRDKIRETVAYILKTCFWNDYNINEEMIINKLKSNDIYFKKFIVSKIVNNSDRASIILKRLFNMKELKRLLPDSSHFSYLSEKIKIIRANLFNEFEDGLRRWK
ncbi:MAG TPA: hypothetical protein PLE45_02395 [Spirochaetota bacterium]|nr:hypothetical protein [Spirochaetota bacterium]HOL55948.1 hypothetical protein [Spirochaetota bacterium]